MFSPVQTEIAAIDSNYPLTSRFGRKVRNDVHLFARKQALNVYLQTVEATDRFEFRMT
jgi:hypothetical protein